MPRAAHHIDGAGGWVVGAIFPVTLALAQDRIDVDGKMIRLAPGMNLTEEIKTRKRRVTEYLLSPIQKAGVRI